MMSTARLPFRRPLGLLPSTLLAALVTSLAACAEPPERPEAGPGGPVPAVAPPSTQVYFYPTAGQSEAQQDRDRYECHLWAVKRTGYDPGQPPLAPHQRVIVEARPPPGTDTVAGAATGAVLGAVVSAPYHTGEGAAIGAAAGAVLGAASDASRQAQAERVQQSYDQADRARYAEVERRTADYRRAMTACLEGRGYKVE